MLTLSVISLNAIMVIVIVSNITIQNAILQNASMPNDLASFEIYIYRKHFKSEVLQGVDNFRTSRFHFRLVRNILDQFLPTIFGISGGKK